MLRQLDVLARHGDVTTLSYGERPDAAHDHLQIDSALPSLPQTVSGVLKLALRRYRSVALDAPAVRAAREALGAREFDIVVANEARALPLARAVAGSPRIWCDLHEWAPAERSHVLSWRLLVAPFMDWVCRTYLPGVDAATTVNQSIATMYEEHFGARTEVVRNAMAYCPDLAPSPLASDRIRLVHSGGAVAGRNIEAIIEAVDLLGDRYSLDLYLIQPRQADGYWRKLADRIAASAQTTLHPAVRPADLPQTLNAYDLGVFVLPPHTPNHRLMLPNKFFDFVQARLGIVFGPAVETDRLIRDHRLGVITEGYTAADLVRAIQGISREDVARFKQSAHDVAELLSSEADIAVQDAILTRLVHA
ncbi:glycosyltransferase [Microbacterium sp. 2FI]|uniref:glycosyltransferase n=1 Tax=Microbacterium sp. 2FI TaxID=2502193 RepID=UPI002017992E|nr:glycosyltransferase [Microbacterium sp. 2FI]